MHSQDFYDVIVMGGGLAGSTLARHLHRSQPSLRLLVLEAATYPLPEAKHKVGESSVDIAGYYFGKVLGLADYLDHRHLPKFGLRFFMPQGDNSDVTTRVEVGNYKRPDSKSYQLDRGRLENDLRDMLLADGVEFLDGCRVKDFDLDPTRKQVSYTHDGQIYTAAGRWLVDASGMRQLIKQKLGLHKDVGLSHCSAWFRVDEAVSVNDLSDNETFLNVVPARARAMSTTHLMGEGYWFWIIPLGSGTTSLGIVTDPRYHPLETYDTMEKAMAWLRKHEPQMARRVEKIPADKIMDFKRLANFAYGCKQVFSVDRWAMTGISGTFTDPFYSPGSDFISIANTYIDKLIREDLEGRDIRSSVQMLQEAYFRGYDLILATIQGQYPIFANPLVMSHKLLWDATTAWSGVGLLFAQGLFTCQETLDALRDELMIIDKLHMVMQRFFLEAASRSFSQQPAQQIIVDTTMNYMHRMQSQLNKPMDRPSVLRAVKHNVNILCTVATETFKVLGQGDIQQSPLGPLVKGRPSVEGVSEDLQSLIFGVQVAAQPTSVTA